MYETQSYTKIFSNSFVLYASFLYRFAAACIDTLVIGVLSTIIYIAIPHSTSPLMVSLLCLFIITTSWLYYATMESSTGQATIGKKALGIKVVGTLGQPLSFGQASARFFAKMISGCSLFIGCLMMLWDSRKQSLHDKITGTYVVTRG